MNNATLEEAKRAMSQGDTKVISEMLRDEKDRKTVRKLGWYLEGATINAREIFLANQQQKEDEQA
jgi:hypothetical protein